jgi:hypothetical protein
VSGHGSTGDLSETSDDVDDTWWETGLLDQFAGDVCGERCLLSSLQHDGVTSGDGRTNLP